jgi:hypothetical protein
MPRRKSKRSVARAASRRADIWPASLDEDAAVYAYHVDAAILDAWAVIPSEYEPAQLVTRAREGVWLAAVYADMSVRNFFVRRPQVERAVKRCFKDLDRIQLLIDRNKHLDDFALTAHTTITRRPWMTGDEIRQLRASLNEASTAIAKLLRSRKPVVTGGNHDPLTRQFLDGMFDLWCDCFSGEGADDETRLFVRLCAAAWPDVKFPTRARDGVSLDDWLRDRIRKQFPDGVCAARQSRQDRQWEQEPPEEPPDGPPPMRKVFG